MPVNLDNIRFPDMEPSSSATGPSSYYDKSKKSNIIRDASNKDKIVLKKLREEEAAVKEYCEKHGILVGDWSAMLENAKQRLNLQESRRGDEVTLKDHTIIINPRDEKTIAVQQSVEAAFRTPSTPPPLERGRVKEGPIS